MNICNQIATHLRQLHFGNNWTAVTLQDTLADVSWEDATTKVFSLNTIAALVFHANYYVEAVLKVLKGGSLDSSDKLSFDHPPIRSQQDWEQLLYKTQAEANELADLIAQFPEERLWQVFVEDKYGSYYRNFHGVIEHTHYHLGQIVLIKKILQEKY